VFTYKEGTVAINEVAPLEPTENNVSGDWLEICNQSGQDIDITDWTLRALAGGQLTTLHTFGRGDALVAGRYNVVGPLRRVPDVHALLDIPSSTGPIVLKLYNEQRTLVDAFEYVAPPGLGRTVITRRCDCKSVEGEERDVVTMLPSSATPGGESFDGECGVSNFPADGGVLSGTSSSSSAAGGPALPCSAEGCHPFYPLDSAGRTWTSGLMSSGSTGQQVLQTRGPAPSGGFQVHEETAYDGNSAIYDRVYDCDANRVSQRSLQSTITTSSGITITNDTTFEPALDLVRETAVGSTFTQSLIAHAQLTTPMGPVDRDSAVEQTVTVEDMEDVSVGCGVFNAARLTQTASIDGTITLSTYWFVERLGIIKSSIPPPAALPGSLSDNVVFGLTACGF
jgi:hypothetical protein